MKEKTTDKAYTLCTKYQQNETVLFQLISISEPMRRMLFKGETSRSGCWMITHPVFTLADGGSVGKLWATEQKSVSWNSSTTKLLWFLEQDLLTINCSVVSCLNYELCQPTQCSTLCTAVLVSLKANWCYFFFNFDILKRKENTHKAYYSYCMPARLLKSLFSKFLLKWLTKSSSLSRQAGLDSFDSAASSIPIGHHSQELLGKAAVLFNHATGDTGWATDLGLRH